MSHVSKAQLPPPPPPLPMLTSVTATKRTAPDKLSRLMKLMQQPDKPPRAKRACVRQPARSRSRRPVDRLPSVAEASEPVESSQILTEVHQALETIAATQTIASGGCVQSVQPSDTTAHQLDVAVVHGDVGEYLNDVFDNVLAEAVAAETPTRLALKRRLLKHVFVDYVKAELMLTYPEPYSLDAIYFVAAGVAERMSLVL